MVRMKRTGSLNFWMMSWWKDLLTFFPAIWATLLFFSLAKFGGISLKSLPLQLLSLINSVHTGLPIAYSIFFYSEMTKESQKNLLRGIFAIAILTVSSWYLSKEFPSYMLFVVPTAFVLLATFHFYRQDLGICSMYRSKDPQLKPFEVKLERFMVLLGALMIPTIYWLAYGGRYKALTQWSYDHTPFITALAIMKYLFATLFVFYIPYQIFFKKNLNPRFLYFGGIGIFLTSMLAPQLLIFPFLIEYMSRIFNHDWIEIGVQSRLLRYDFQKKDQRTKVLLCIFLTAAIAVFFNYTKVVYTFLTAVQETGQIDGSQFFNHIQDPYFQIWTSLYFFASAYHYFVGRYVYDFKNAKLREKLDFGNDAKILNSQI